MSRNRMDVVFGDREIHLSGGGVEDVTLLVDPNRHATSIHTARQALDAHIEYDRWLATDAGSFNAACVRGANIEDPVERADMIENHRLETDVAAWLGVHRFAVRKASTWFMSAEMGDLVDGLAAANDRPARLARTDVPEPSGILWLEKPWTPASMFPEHVDYLRGRGLVWQMVEPGPIRFPLGAEFWSPPFSGNFRRPGDHVDVELAATDVAGLATAEASTKLVEKHGGLLVWPLSDAGLFLVESDSWENMGRPPALTADLISLPFDVDLIISSESIWYDTVATRLSTVFRLIWQHAIRPDLETQGGGFRRRWQRSPLANGRSAVAVIHIRRYAPRGTDVDHDLGSGVKLTEPVIVRGHWREQHYRSLGPARTEDGAWNRDSHRRIWIDSHARGLEAGVEPPSGPSHAVMAVDR